MNNSKQYYKGWPSSGEYYNKLNKVHFLLHNYLINFPQNKNKKYTVIFDIDDTLVYTDYFKLLPYKKSPNNYMLFPPIPQMVQIIKLCKLLGFKIIIITARPTASEKHSIKNLQLLNIEYDEIYHNKNYPDLNFKIQLKQKLSLTNNIILSVGDQWPDIQGIYGNLCIKLPSISDKDAYFTFDNVNYFKII